MPRHYQPTFIAQLNQNDFLVISHHFLLSHRKRNVDNRIPKRKDLNLRPSGYESGIRIIITLIYII
jgi:hypothetical protein